MPTLSFPMVFGLIMAAAVFLVVLGIAQARRAAGGSEDFQARLAAYGVMTAGAAAMPNTAGFRDTLTLLSNAIKAGYSFAQAIDTVAKNAVPPIGDEFGRAVREMNLGGSPDEALMNITKRVISPDFDLVATAYSIHRTVGGNLAEILDNIAYTIRERVRIKGEIATLTAQARASGTLITALPIVLAAFMYFVTPTYFRPMFGSIIGWILLAIGGFMIFVGNLIIRRVVAIEV